jgi:hypothetical protein
VYLLVFHAYFSGVLIFKGLTARSLYASFGIKGLIQSFQGPFKMKTTRCIKKWLTIHPMTKGRVAEERNPLLQYSEQVNIHFLDYF